MRLVYAVAVAGFLVGCANAALLQRPEQDCINPSVEKVNQFNFFPEDTRSIIAEPAAIRPGAQVSVQQPSRGPRGRSCKW